MSNDKTFFEVAAYGVKPVLHAVKRLVITAFLVASTVSYYLSWTALLLDQNATIDHYVAIAASSCVGLVLVCWVAGWVRQGHEKAFA